jgi:DNA ligase (NAD+)
MSERFEMLEAFGFTVVTHALLNDGEEEEVFGRAESWCERREEGRSELPFEIDGVVLSLNSNNLQDRMLQVSTNKLRPKHSRAVKFTSKKATTKVIGCAVTVGHTGALIPTAALEKVRVGGVHVQNALLNNWDEIARLDVAVGDEVEVELAGDIIPKVVRVINRPADRTEIGEPETFQVDGTLYKTTRMHRGKEGAMTYLVGAGDTPELKRGKVKHYIGNSKKGVGILGVGDGVLDALVGDGLVETPADLYRLTEEQLVDMVIGKNKAGGAIRFGKSRAKSLLAEIEKAKNLTLAKFLGSLGIDLLGRRRVDILAKQHQLLTLEDWRDPEKLQRISGDTIREEIIKGIEKNSDLINELLAVGVNVEGLVVVEKAAVDGLNESDNGAIAGVCTGKAFCFTGTRELLEDVEAAGGIIKSGVSKNCDYLVQKDPTSRTNKTQKAEANGVEIIGIEYLRKVLAGEAKL